MLDGAGVGAAGHDGEVGVEVLIRVLEEGDLAFIDTIALVGERCHFIVLPAVLLAIDVDDRANDIDIVMPGIFADEVEHDAAVSRVVGDVVNAANCLEVLIGIVGVENHLELVGGRRNEAARRRCALVALVHAAYIHTGTGIGVGAVGAVLNLHAHCNECAVLLKCHGINGVMSAVGKLGSFSIEQVALNIVAAAEGWVVEDCLAIVACLLVAEVAFHVVVLYFICNTGKSFAHFGIAFHIFVCLVVAILEQSQQVCIGIVAVEDGVELVVNPLDYR